MIVHSDMEIGFVLALLVLFGAAIAFVVSGILVVERKFRTAAKVAKTTLRVMGVWVIAVTLVSFLTPQTIVKVGDSYCEEIRCIGIDRVRAEPKGAETAYKLDVHIFSDANTVKVSLGAVSLFLEDDQRRRFPLIDDLSVLPYDTFLNPGQKINTTLTFATASDARQLFLKFGSRSKAAGAKPAAAAGKKPPAWATLPLGVLGAWFYVATFGRDDSPFHKPTVLRVL